MTQDEFKPKGEEQIKTEILEETGMDYEENKEAVDKLVAREVEGERKKESFHTDKKKHQEKTSAYKQRMIDKGLDPETGEKLEEKPEGKTEPSKDGDKLSGEDVLALVEISDKEDREFIVQEAKDRGKTVQEIIDSENTQIILKSRVEKRKMANAANMGGGKRGSETTVDKEILSKIDKQDEDMTDDEIKRGAKLIVDEMKKSQ